MKQVFYLFGIALLAIGCSSQQENKSMNEGKTERDQISVTTKIPGRVAELRVQAGQLVEKGDTLLVLELPEVDAKAQQAEGAVQAAKAQYEMALKGATEGQLKQLNAKVDGLKEQHEFAQKSLKRMENLLVDSLISQQQYDEVFAKAQGAKNQYLAALAEREEAHAGARVEQQAMALGQSQRALGALQETQVAESERFILAPQRMRVETINLHVGELALAGYSLVSGYLENSVYFRLTLPEHRLAGFKVGQELQLSFPFLENKELSAKLLSIKPLSGYANIASAYPDFQQQETLFELRLAPVDAAAAYDIPTKSTFVIKSK